MGKKPAIRLTRRDWEEIYYALETKLHSLSVAIDTDWTAHLTTIIGTIGVDGRVAASQGVKPVSAKRK